MDPVLLALLTIGTAISLAVVGRRLRDRERQLIEIAAPLGTQPSAAAIVTVIERRAVAIGRLEQELAETQRDRAFLGDVLGVGALRVDDSGRVDFANAASHALLDAAPATLLGRTVMEAFADARVDGMARQARDEGAASGEFTVTTSTSGSRTLAMRARRSPVRGLWIVLEDVTELRSLQRMRAEFIDNLSHELRTPLSTVSLLAETLAREAAAAEVPTRMRERIGRIEVETGHLVQMVTELLDLSRIEGGGSLVLRDDVDLRRLAAAAVDRLRLFAERSEIALTLDAADDVPGVQGDEERLAQVFLNLVHNALKFSEPGGTVTVGVRCDRSGRAVIATVADQGIGIPKADRARIFERFYKVDRARVRRGGGGTGLGLSIARHVVEQHGGRIWVESQEGRGSVFSFSIPLAAGDA